MLVLDGETLRTLRVMAIDNIETPEGIAFSHGCTYIARCRLQCRTKQLKQAWCLLPGPSSQGFWCPSQHLAASSA